MQIDEKEEMVSRSDFYHELMVDIIGTCLFALLFIIISLLNYYAKSSSDSPIDSPDTDTYDEQDKTNNETTQISTTTSSSL